MGKPESSPSVDYHVHIVNESIVDPLERTQQAHEVIDLMAHHGIVAGTLVSRVAYPSNITEYIEYGKGKGIKLYAGVEFVAPQVNGDKRVDLIAMAFDPDNFAIQKILGQDGPGAKQASADLAEWQKEFLENQGFSLVSDSPEDKEMLARILSGEINAKADAYCKLLVKNKSNSARIESIIESNKEEWELISSEYGGKAHYLEDTSRLIAKFLWKHFFDADKPGFKPSKITLPEIIKVVNQAGGIVLYSPESPERQFNSHTWEQLKKVGIDGLMGWHADKLEPPLDVVKQARAEGMLILGGSDFDPKYGMKQQDQTQWVVGTGAGKMWISPRRQADVENYLNEKLPNKIKGSLVAKSDQQG